MVRSDVAPSDSPVEYDYPRVTAQFEDLRQRNAIIEEIRIQQLTKSDPVTPIRSLTASRDAVQVQAVIRERYGFEATLTYCAALVDFVEALTDGQ